MSEENKKTEKIRELLDSQQLETYDFREEIVGFKGSDSIDRFFVYKALGIKLDGEGLGYEEAKRYVESETSEGSEGYEEKCEADNCTLAQAVYRCLWDEKHLVHCKDSGDTMNSCFMTFAEYLKPLVDGLEMTIDCWKRAHWGNRKLFCLYYEHKKRMTKLLEPARGFLNVAYTIGNLIPVPAGCNGPRGIGPTRDYWDLALLNVYQWYKDRDDAKLKDMLRNRGEEVRPYVKLYIEWLDSFGSWDRFVIANYMQDFVKKADPEEDAGIFGFPRELWDGHFDGAPLPVTHEQCNAFFSRTAKYISARSVRMVSALRTKENIE